MKYFIFFLFLISCNNNSYSAKPVEYYKNKGFVVIDKQRYGYYRITVKSTDSIFDIPLHSYDWNIITIGDTL
jgi:hypothetical protein